MADRRSDEEGFLSRWSRRKRSPMPEERDEEIEAEAPEEAVDAIADEAVEAADEPDEEAEENRRAAEAVDIESLTYEDDFKLFLKRGVPGALRQKALRKLWVSNPILANLDGLNDYEEDFNDPKMKVYSSAWKAGRGFLSELELKAQQATGRISQPVEEEEDLNVAEVADEAAGPLDAAEEALPEQAAEASPPETFEDSEDEDLDKDVDPDAEAEDDARPQRVSIRRRWEV